MLFKVDGDTTLEELERVLRAHQVAVTHWTWIWDKHIVTLSVAPGISAEGRGATFIEALNAALADYHT